MTLLNNAMCGLRSRLSSMLVVAALTSFVTPALGDEGCAEHRVQLAVRLSMVDIAQREFDLAIKAREPPDMESRQVQILKQARSLLEAANDALAFVKRMPSSCSEDDASLRARLQLTAVGANGAMMIAELMLDYDIPPSAMDE